MLPETVLFLLTLSLLLASTSTSLAQPNNTLAPTLTPDVVNNYSYICLNSDQNLCLGISPGGNTPPKEDGDYLLQIKNRQRVESKGDDWKKTRWDVNFNEGLISLSGFEAEDLFIGQRGPETTRVTLRAPKQGLTYWNLDSLWYLYNATQNTSSSPPLPPPGNRSASIFQVDTNMCLTVMRCKAGANDYCDPSSTDPVKFDAQLEAGSYVKIRECNPDLAISQEFRQALDCNQGCPPEYIGDGVCTEACMTAACDWDGWDCNSTAPSLAPSWLPTGAPTNFSETAQPTLGPSGRPSSQPTSTPTLGPTSGPTWTPTRTMVPTEQPTTAQLTSAPSMCHCPPPQTVSPTLQPTTGPTERPFNSQVYTAMLILFVVLCWILLVYSFYLYHKLKKQREYTATLVQERTDCPLGHGTAEVSELSLSDDDDGPPPLEFMDGAPAPMYHREGGMSNRSPGSTTDSSTDTNTNMSNASTNMDSPSTRLARPDDDIVRNLMGDPTEEDLQRVREQSGVAHVAETRRLQERANMRAQRESP